MDALASSSLLFFILLLLLPGTISVPPTSTGIGVTYTLPFSPSTPSLTPEHVADAVNSFHFRRLRLLHAEPKLIRSFAYTNVSLFLSIPNSVLLPLASNRTIAVHWLYGHVLPFYPRSKISVISVGEDAVSSELVPYLLPAIRNVYLALRDLGISRISVSTTFSFVNAVTTPFPPSAANFQEPLGELVIRPLLQFLEDTNSSFLVKIYPYNMYRIYSEIPIGFALFQEHPFNFRDDLVTGVRYRNLFDMMADAVITSMALAGHQNVPLIVAETGWPSSGGEFSEVDATLAFSEKYTRGLLAHLSSGLGTPLRKEGVAETYIFELIDKEGKEGSRNWGLLYANMSKKYKIDFSGTSKNNVAVIFLIAICLFHGVFDSGFYKLWFLG
ncbi:glucan endo-1,3-beta-glucosidase 2 [Euphorbia lathyris]|uniref:glucan endo-1,3-beta-glucosidase 2 n=1 Tax=Euphorbia lathyris TaxID=212925 RepID=UPI003313F49E